MRRRFFPSANYQATFLRGKTLRFAIQADQPITALEFPEFYDVAINTKCHGGCPWCYASSTSQGVHFANVPQKIQTFFGEQSLNERPFQVAIGGAGEPTLHPEFPTILQTFKQLQITPNYTTNGMHLSPEVLEATKAFCGGVALTLHPHLEHTWKKAISQFTQAGIRLNAHLIISDEDSVVRAKQAFQEYEDAFEYFVLLPYMNVGFASGANAQTIHYPALESWLGKGKSEDLIATGKIAFGAYFFEFLQRHPEYQASLYPPEIFSKYLVLDDPVQMYTNSFHHQPAPFPPRTNLNQVRTLEHTLA